MAPGSGENGFDFFFFFEDNKVAVRPIMLQTRVGSGLKIKSGSTHNPLPQKTDPKPSESRPLEASAFPSPAGAPPPPPATGYDGECGAGAGTGQIQSLTNSLIYLRPPLHLRSGMEWK